MFLGSSNRKKLEEFARFGLELELRPGVDLSEVNGTPEEVAVHKAIAAGTGAVVEDTVIFVDGCPWVDVRWKKDELKKSSGLPASWRVTLAHNDGQNIYLYVGIQDGVLTCPDEVRPQAFGFDPFFIPDGQNLSLDELELLGQKDTFSARRLAALALVEDRPTNILSVSSIQQWAGEWQGSPPK